jgi:Asp-tRNA(Asn)/Glu-tRNA(Gln) amidotransferase A subunit family amidase
MNLQQISRCVEFFYIALLTLALLIAQGVSAQSSYDVAEVGIAELQEALEEGRVTSVELVDQYLARIAAYDHSGPELNSIVRINPQARKLAEEMDAERSRSGSRGMLHGIPILVKDNFNTIDMPTTNGSVALADFIPNANSTQIQKLLDAGAIVLAKTTLHEYARGYSTIASLTGQTRNPYDNRRLPGGSSGGTGASVAASFAAIGMGSDTCGSIRVPSAFNNLFGLRPTKGLSSIHGIIPLSHTQDVGGPLARSLDDLAILLDIVVGYDANDPATEVMRDRSNPQFRQNLDSAAITGLRLGKLITVFADANDSIREPVEEALQWYEDRGARIIEVEISMLEQLQSASGVIGFEFQPDLEQYLGQFGSSEISRLEDIVNSGLFHSRAMSARIQPALDEEAYADALDVRTELLAAIEMAFLDHNLDALVYPTVTENPAFTSERQSGTRQCSIAANAGLPALSIPVGLNSLGLPVGMEFLGLPFHDAQLLAMAWPYEQEAEPREPPSATPSLTNNAAPPPRVLNIDFDSRGARFQGSLEMDITTNLLSYEVEIPEDSKAEIFAVTLSIDNQDDSERIDPIFVNLMGPNRTQATGEFFMSQEFRRAFDDGALLWRVFAEGFPVEGVSQVVE